MTAPLSGEAQSAILGLVAVSAEAMPSRWADLNEAMHEAQISPGSFRTCCSDDNNARLEAHNSGDY